jgi:hypothetical protein
MTSHTAFVRWTLIAIAALGYAPPASGQSRIADPAVPPSVIYVGAIDIDPTGRAPADIGFGIDVNEQLTSDTTLTAFYIRGANPGIVRAFQYGLHRSRFHASIEHRGWMFAGGEVRSQRRLFGAPIVGDGVTIARETGLVVGSFTAVRPKHFSGNGGGHLVEGRVGLRRGAFTVGAFASDLARVRVRLSPIGSIQLPEDDSELTLEDLAHLGHLLPREHRVTTGGIDSQVRAGAHMFIARTALVEQINADGARRSGVAGEGTYSFVNRHASLTASLRWLPKVLPDIELPGNAATMSVKARLTRAVKAIARAYGAESLAFGRTHPTRTRGGAAGVEYGNGAARLELLANYRDAQTTSFRRTRTISSAFRAPVGRLTAEGRMEIGHVEANQQTHQVALYRASMHIDAEPTSIMGGVSYQDYGPLPPRARADASLSTTWRGIVAEFGVGAGKSQLFGDDVGAWMSVDAPLPGALMLNIGVDYERWLYATSRYVTFVPDVSDLASPWRVTVSFRKHLALFRDRHDQVR